MTQDREHFYAVQSFLEDDELCKIWNIIEIAMEREGYDVQNAELSMRLYDPELTQEDFTKMNIGDRVQTINTLCKISHYTETINLMDYDNEQY